MRSMPLSSRIVVIVGTIIGTWTSNYIIEYRAQAWANAPVENWTGEYKPTSLQTRDLRARERALHVWDDQQLLRNDEGDHAQLDAP